MTPRVNRIIPPSVTGMKTTNCNRDKINQSTITATNASNRIDRLSFILSCILAILHLLGHISKGEKPIEEAVKKYIVHLVTHNK
jgi:hypothetical protein